MPTTYEIHPSIGIARLGPSTDFFMGPEPDGTFPPPVTQDAAGAFHSIRDSNGHLLSQAARYSVFEVDRVGAQLVSAREVQSAEADISWQVHVVNQKGAAPR